MSSGSAELGRNGDSWIEHVRASHVFIFVLAASIVAPTLIVLMLPDWQARGQFGDLFGFLNCIFSGLAFAAVFYAIVLQSRQLALQRAEIAMTKEELIKSRSANVLFESMKILGELQPMWRQLYGFPIDHRQWDPEQKAIADRVGNGLQEVAYFCLSGLLDSEIIKARNAPTFSESWRRLKGFIQDYREKCGEPRELKDGAFQRKDLEAFAEECREYMADHYSRLPYARRGPLT